MVDAFILFNYTVIEQLRRKILDHLNVFTKINRQGRLEIEELDVIDKIRESDGGGKAAEPLRRPIEKY